MASLRNLLRASATLPRRARNLRCFGTTQIQQSAAASSELDSGAWMPTTTVSELATGLRVVTEAVRPAATCAVGVWIDSGSRCETPSTSGVAHFLEHLIFKGTRNRSRAALEVEVENMGAHFNAYTTRESTVYWIKTTEENLDWAVEILSDLLLASELRQEAIDRERGVILTEMRNVNEIMEEYVMDELHSVSFRDQGLGMAILGPVENVQSISRRDITGYIQGQYLPSRIVVVATGAVAHENLEDLAKRHFAPWAVPGAPPAFNTLDPTGAPAEETAVDFQQAVFTPGERRQILARQDLSHVGFAFEGASWKSHYALPLQLLQTMLGGQYDRLQPVDHSAPFFQEIAARNLMHTCNVSNISYKDTGVFGVYCKADPRDQTSDPVPEPVLPALTEALVRHITRFAFDVSEEELHRAKVNLKSLQLATTDSFERLAEELGRQMLSYGRRMTATEICERIDSVSVDDVKATARALCVDVDHAMVAVGQVDGYPTYEWIQKLNRSELLDPRRTGYDWRKPWGGLPPPELQVQHLQPVPEAAAAGNPGSTR